MDTPEPTFELFGHEFGLFCARIVFRSQADFLGHDLAVDLEARGQRGVQAGRAWRAGPVPFLVPPVMPRLKVTAFGFFFVPALLGDTLTFSWLVVLAGSPSLGAAPIDANANASTAIDGADDRLAH